MGKTKTETTKPAKVPYVYAIVFYGGIIKTGYSLVKVTHESPEVCYNELQEFFGQDVNGFKGRYVRCTKPIDTVKAELADKLKEFKWTDMAYNTNATEVVKHIKDVCEASKCKTMGVYEKADGDSSNAKKAAKDDSDSEDEAPKKNKSTKKSTKAETDDEEPKKAEKPKGKKAAPKNETEDEESEDEAPKKQAKGKGKEKEEKSSKKAAKADSDSEEEAPKKAEKPKAKGKDTKESKESKEKDSKSKVKKAKVESDSDDDIPVPKKGNQKTVILASDSEEEN